jgi:hypothetical protein
LVSDGIPRCGTVFDGGPAAAPYNFGGLTAAGAADVITSAYAAAAGGSIERFGVDFSGWCSLSEIIPPHLFLIFSG